MSAELFRLIADKIEADPTLLEGCGSMNLDASAGDAGMAKLLFILRDQEWESVQWKGYFPFSGIPSKDEVKRLSWNSRN